MIKKETKFCSKKEINEKLITVLTNNILNSLFNQMILQQRDYQLVKDTIVEVMSVDRLFTQQVGYSNIFELTIDFNDFINRVIREVLKRVKDN